MNNNSDFFPFFHKEIFKIKTQTVLTGKYCSKTIQAFEINRKKNIAKERKSFFVVIFLKSNYIINFSMFVRK